MSLKDALQKKIDKKNNELNELRFKRTQIEAKILAAESYIEGVQDSIRSADKSSNANHSNVKRAVKAGSATDKAQKALRKLGRPTHISELLREMGIDDTIENQRNVGSSLSHSYRNGRIFTRPQSKTFGLIEWEETQDFESKDTPHILNWHPSQWDNIVALLPVTGMPLQLARHSILSHVKDNQIHLHLDPSYESLAAPRWKERLQEKLSEYAQFEVELRVEVPKTLVGYSPAMKEKQESITSLEELARQCESKEEFEERKAQLRSVK